MALGKEMDRGWRKITFKWMEKVGTVLHEKPIGIVISYAVGLRCITVYWIITIYWFTVHWLYCKLTDLCTCKLARFLKVCEISHFILKKLQEILLSWLSRTRFSTFQFLADMKAASGWPRFIFFDEMKHIPINKIVPIRETAE